MRQDFIALATACVRVLSPLETTGYLILRDVVNRITVPVIEFGVDGGHNSGRGCFKIKFWFATT